MVHWLNIKDTDPFYERAVWEYKFAIWPRRSVKENKLIWFTKAYKGEAMWTGPGDPVFEVHWLTAEEFTFAKLRGEIK